MKIPEMGGQTPEAKKSMEQNLQRAEALSAEIRQSEQEIQRVTIELREQRTKLTEEFKNIAEEVSRNVPKVPCSSTDDDGALESGAYYVIGLPEGVDPKKVMIDAGSRWTDLMIDGKKFEGDFDYAKTKEEVLEEILRRRKETENKKE
ncbi:MAG: hypothetical protein NUV84_00980 [Candidatus Uhrbacteria bacterium]|nr:hypothetical protein [Candidatus Uhrbacteria bacterium]